MNKQTVNAVDVLLHVAALLIFFGITLVFVKVTEPVPEEEIIREIPERELPQIIPDIDIGPIKETYAGELEEIVEMSAVIFEIEPIGRYFITAYSHIETGSKLTASGGKVHKGTITTAAADVWGGYFKFGDYVYVEDYGLYRIEDTGSAVRKRHLDLYEPDMKKLDSYTGYKQVYRVSFPFGIPKDS